MKIYGPGKLFLSFLFLVGTSVPALAHSPVCDCYDNGDKTVTCEGGFSDGSSAVGVNVRIEDMQGKVLASGKMDNDSTYTFNKPDQEFHVVFDAGNNHVVTIYSGDIGK